MAAIVEKSLLPRYCPAINFSDVGGSFLMKYQGTDLPRYDAIEVPEQAFLSTSHKNIADFVSIDGHLSMCREARDLIEELEPGVHQFFPVEIVRKRGRKPIYRIDGRMLDERYYFFAPQVRLDAVCVDRSEVDVRLMRDGIPTQVYMRVMPKSYDIVLIKEIINGHHVWYGDNQLRSQLMFSDVLAKMIEDRGLLRLEFHYIMEI